jgi:hypothetical protein
MTPTYRKRYQITLEEGKMDYNMGEWINDVDFARRTLEIFGDITIPSAWEISWCVSS